MSRSAIILLAFAMALAGAVLASGGAILIVNGGSWYYLPAGLALLAIGAATPMTIRSAMSGRQFVVIAAGGHPGLPGPVGGSLLAFALPQQERPR